MRLMILLTLGVLMLANVSCRRKCFNNWSCGSRMYCHGGRVTARGRRLGYQFGYCIPKRRNGQKCMYSVGSLLTKWGGDGNSCLSNKCICSNCYQKAPNGHHCSTNHDCQSGVCGGFITVGCSGRCAPDSRKIPDGHRCSRAYTCAAGQCTCGYCGKHMPYGYKCSTDNNCKSRRCKGGWTGTFGCRGRCR